MPDRILIATDFSDRSLRAQARAAMLCKALGVDSVELCTVEEGGLPATLATLSNVTEPSARKIVADRSMHELDLLGARLLKDHGVKASSKVLFGHPAKELALRAQEMNAELIVLGAHGCNFISSLVLGNTADKLVRLARTPLLVVKNEARAAYRQVLVPVDFSEHCLAAARLAMKLAPDAVLTFLHVYEVFYESTMRYASVSSKTIEDYRDRARENARVQLNHFIAGLQIDEGRTDRALVHGSPRHAVCEFAEKNKPDLIAMGKHGRSRFEELLVGSLTRDTLDQTASDVLVSMTL